MRLVVLLSSIFMFTLLALQPSQYQSIDKRKLLEYSFNSPSATEKRMVRAFMAKTYPETAEGYFARAYMEEKTGRLNGEKFYQKSLELDSSMEASVLNACIDNTPENVEQHYHLMTKTLNKNPSFYNYIMFRTLYYNIIKDGMKDKSLADRTLNEWEQKLGKDIFVFDYIRGHEAKSKNNYEMAEKYFHSALTKKGGAIDIDTWDSLIYLQINTMSDRDKGFETIRSLYGQGAQILRRYNSGERISDYERSFAAKAFELIAKYVKETSPSSYNQIIEQYWNAFEIWPCVEYISAIMDYSSSVGSLSDNKIADAQRKLGNNSSFYKTLMYHYRQQHLNSMADEAYEKALKYANNPIDLWNAIYGYNYEYYRLSGKPLDITPYSTKLLVEYPSNKIAILQLLIENSLKNDNVQKAKEYLKEYITTKKAKNESYNTYEDIVDSYTQRREMINAKSSTKTFPQILPTTTLYNSWVDFTPDGKYFITDNELWDAKQGIKVNSFPESMRERKISPNGIYVATINYDGYMRQNKDGSNDWYIYTLAIIDIKTGKILKQRLFDDKIRYFDWSPDSKELVLRMQGSYLNKLRVDTMEITATEFIKNDKWTGDIKWSPNGKEIAFIQRGDRGDVCIHDAKTLKEIDRFSEPSWPHALAYSFDGQYLLVADNTHTLHRWNRVTKAYQKIQISTFTTDIQPYINEQKVVLNNQNRTTNDALVVDVEKMKILASIPSDTKDTLYKVLPNSTIASWQISGNSMRFLDANTLQEKYKIEGASVDSYEMFLTDNNQTILLYDKEEVSLWSVKSAQKVHAWKISANNMIQDANNKNIFYSFAKDKATYQSTLWQFDASTKKQTQIMTVPVLVDEWGFHNNKLICAGTPLARKPLASHDGKILFIDMDTKSIVRTLMIPLVTDPLSYDNVYESSGFQSIDISPNGKYFAIGTYWQDGFGHGITYSKHLRIFDTNGVEVRKFHIGETAYGRFIDNDNVYCSKQKYNIHSGLSEKHDGNTTKTTFYSRGNGSYRFEFEKYNLRLNSNNLIYEDKKGMELARIINKKNGEWLAYAKSGEFVASAKGTEKVIWRLSDTEYADFDKFYEAYYRPDLITEILKNGKLEQKTKESIKLAPKIEIINTQTVTNEDKTTITLKLTNQGGGIGQIRLYRNGSSVMLEGERALKKVQSSDVRTYTISLEKGINKIKAIAFNADNTMQSEDSLLNITANIQSVKPSLHAIVVGINEFKNSKISLNLAVDDAKYFSEILKKQSSKLFENIDIKLLTSKDQTSKDSIVSELKGMQTINPNDLFVFYVASHGTVEEGKYYLVTSNVGALSTRKLQEDAITQDLLKELIGNIPTSKKLILLDTCFSGAMGSALIDSVKTRGLSEDAAIKTLNRSVGGSILSASTNVQEALEGYNGHGLFTYVLTDGLSGKADSDNDGFIKTTELSNYIEDTVPELAEKVFKRAQYPTINNVGQGFPIGKRQKDNP